ncbi:MAG: Bax inhibitor-1/YccA family protein [Propionibacteriaceae bacterium]
MLRSSNPILSKQDAFTPGGRGGQQGARGFAPYPGQGSGQGPYGTDPYQQQVSPSEGRMTFDDVITKTIMTMAILVAGAAVGWFLVPDTIKTPVMIVSALVGFAAVLVVSLRRVINPAFVLAYAAIEGVFIGIISYVFESIYPGIVVQAVFATLVAAGVTLAAYKIFNIRVTAKFQKIVILSTVAFAAVMLINFVVVLVTNGTGLRGGLLGPVSPLAVGISAIAIVLCVLNLILDFDYIEKGVAAGAPARESWRGAFGLTVTMVWLYIEMLRLLSYLRR